MRIIDDRERSGTGLYRWLLVSAGVLIAVLVVGVIAGVVSRKNDEQRSAEEARTVCEDEVRDELQARASASFTDGPAKGESFSLWGEFYSWSITGTVAAQTDDGEPPRAAWICKASHIDTDWVATVSFA
ncbi:hypothetical protein [Sanguibacter sp. 25GB23B1]|uniref:hypothetical protein n=1 Tax=unclassified Sanguibacter TaxID=2645534 RepID=UPI0032AEE935